jgi:hypothetical protein
VTTCGLWRLEKPLNGEGFGGRRRSRLAPISLTMIYAVRQGRALQESARTRWKHFHEWHPDLLVSDIGANEDGYSLIRDCGAESDPAGHSGHGFNCLRDG